MKKLIGMKEVKKCDRLAAKALELAKNGATLRDEKLVSIMAEIQEIGDTGCLHGLFNKLEWIWD